MIDITERLRECAEFRLSAQETTDLLLEAAREINRLREFAIDMIRADEEELDFDPMENY